MFSESAKYAIQAMIYLAENQKDGMILVSQISDDYDIPKYYLSKLIQTLSKNNLLKSSRGRRGGVKLGKPAKDIKIIDIPLTLLKQLCDNLLSYAGYKPEDIEYYNDNYVYSILNNIN